MLDRTDDEAALVKRVGEVCRAAGFLKVAGATGVTRETIRRYERGLSAPGGQFLRRLCEHLDLSAEWLLCGRGPRLRSELRTQVPENAGTEQFLLQLKGVIAHLDIVRGSEPAVPVIALEPPPDSARPARRDPVPNRNGAPDATTTEAVHLMRDNDDPRPACSLAP